MLTTAGAPEQVETLYSLSKSASLALLDHVHDLGSPARLPACADLRLGADKLACIREGWVVLWHEDREVRAYSEPDWLPHPLPGSLLVPRSEFAVDLVLFDRRQLTERLRADPVAHTLWETARAWEREVDLALCASLSPLRCDPAFQIRRYEAGQPIVVEGAEPDEVYELIDGHAEVLCGGMRVGQVTRGEIFGEVGFLTNGVRTATVRATRTCIVRVLDRETFLPSMENNPRLIITVARTLAHRLAALDEQVRLAG